MLFTQILLFVGLGQTATFATLDNAERTSISVSLSNSNSPEEFRDVARNMFEALESRPCYNSRDVDWDTALKSDYESVAQLERDFAGSSAGSHLTIAKDDAAYEHAISVARGVCISNSQSRNPREHVEYIHRKVAGYISQLREMSLGVNAQPAADLLENAAGFRYSVRRLTEMYHSLCPWTSLGSNFEVFARGRAELEKFEQRIHQTPWSDQYEIAKSDVIYQRSQVIPECDEPDPTPISELSDKVLASTTERIEEFETFMRFSMPK